MDAGGRMVLGEPGKPASHKGGRAHTAAPAVDIDLAQTWRDIPKPAKIGVSSGCLLLGVWLLFPSMMSGTSYEKQAEAIGRALLHGNRDKVIASATSATAEAAGKWYDVAYTPIQERGPGSSSSETIRASLMSGNPDKDGSEINVSVVVFTDTVSTNLSLDMVNEGGSWKVDAVKSLAEAERALPVKIAKKK